MSEAESAPSRLDQHARRFWRFLFLSHALGAACAAWMLPGGFPLTHLKFWSNEVCCPLLAVAMACGVWADVQNRREVLGPLAFGAAMLWLVGGLSAAILFPYSMLGKGIFALAAGALAMGLAAWSFQGTRLLARSASLVGFTALGFLLVLAQRGRDPATHPQSLKPLVLRTGITDVPWHWRIRNWDPPRSTRNPSESI